MSQSVWVEVGGVPAPKGSVSAFPLMRKRTGKMGAVVVHSKRSKGWETLVREALEGMRALGGEVGMELWFFLPRPMSVTRGKRPYPGVRPDLDKLERSTLDALLGLIDDDSRVVDLAAHKRYADKFPPGAFVHVWRMPEGEGPLAKEERLLFEVRAARRAEAAEDAAVGKAINAVLKRLEDGPPLPAPTWGPAKGWRQRTAEGPFLPGGIASGKENGDAQPAEE